MPTTRSHDPGCLALVPDFDDRDCTCLSPRECSECGSQGDDVKGIPPFSGILLCKPCRQAIQCTG